MTRRNTAPTPKSRLPRRLAGLLCCAGLVAGLLCGRTARAADDESPVSFRNDVMAVLSKAGCNAGACHGNKSGKGGFKLSLRGQDPGADFNVLTRDLFARRTDPLDPDGSLILLKATTQVPHEGGLRFKRDSVEYGLVRRWVAAGTPRDSSSAPVLTRLEVTPAEQVVFAPADEVRIKATAVFSDGTRRDVSRLAVYEQSADVTKITPDGLVQYGWERKGPAEVAVIVRYLQCQQAVRLTFVPDRPGFAWGGPTPATYVDEAVYDKLRTLRINPSPSCTDGEYLRRASLDLLGVLPTPEEAKAFLDDASADKRAKLVDRLLDRPEYADFWAMKWSDLLRNEERTLDRKGVQAFHHWLRQGVADNKPLDQFARELVSARGSTYTNPPANYYRALRDPVTRGETTAQVFLGTRLQCAQCHNHPFDRWTQDDYYGWASVFSRVDYKVLENRRRDTNDSHEFVGEQIVYENPAAAFKDPRGGAPAKPRLLGADAVPNDQDRLDALAAWVTSPDNPFFAKAQVNRVWFHLMGRGIVDPVDDFRATNPPTHPQLLDRLAKDFVAHGYDTRWLIRLVMTSQAYALSGQPNDTNADDETNYSHAVPRRLTAEQLLDAQHQVAGVPTEFAGYPKGTRAGELPGVQAARPREGGRPTDADRFLATFGKPPRLLACDCERSNETTLGQTFQLVSGPETARLLSASDNRIGRLMADGRTDGQIIDELYWAALTRPPTTGEASAMADHVRKAPDRRKGLEDVMWAVLNAKEFVFR